MQKKVLVRTMIVICILLTGEPLWAAIHRAPIIIKASQIKEASRYPLESYRLFRRGPKGEAIPIPFQIDEINDHGDYILPEGLQPNSKTSNGYFDLADELSFMGDDVGEVGAPVNWPQQQPPHYLYEIKFDLPAGKDFANLTNYGREGAVYLGIYVRDRPPLSENRYVVFNLKANAVKTSRYEYFFDPKNYLVVDRIETKSASTTVNGDEKDTKQTFIRSSSFFMRADLKYFLTILANHRSVDSRLDAYKSGPIRTIVKVTFFYKFLKLNFEVGMYTEVSFFSNSVILPAVMYMPIDGTRLFNDGSGFYYGFAFEENPANFKIETNMKKVTDAKNWFEFFQTKSPKSQNYWARILAENSMIYLNLRLSPEMIEKSNVPSYYLEPQKADLLKVRPLDETQPFGQSPVNLALYFDLTKFHEGEHHIAFQLFFENRLDEELLKSFGQLENWQISLKRL